jgi:glycosyltransferase involved in cell wall biosynthesis
MPEPVLNVLLIAPSLDITGGQAVQADRLLRALRGQPGLAVTFLPFNARLPRPLGQLPYIRTVLRLLVYLLRLAWRVPRYEVLHVFTAAYWSYNLWTLPALFFAKLYGRKIVVNYRDGQAEDHIRHWPAALPTLRRMDAIVAPSGYLVDVFARYGLQGRSIYNIIDMEAFRYRPRNLPRPRFLHNRGLEPLYNVPCTLRAFQIIQQRYPEAELTIAHDGPLRAELERLAARLGLRNCRFIGRVPQRDIAALYDAADIYLTSPDIDCMPGSLLECYASGLPVVATRAGGIPYIAVHEETALLVPPGDHEAMAAAALRLLEEPGLAARLAAAAHQYCRTFSADTVGRQWGALYRELASGAA